MWSKPVMSWTLGPHTQHMSSSQTIRVSWCCDLHCYRLRVQPKVFSVVVCLLLCWRKDVLGWVLQKMLYQMWMWAMKRNELCSQLSWISTKMFKNQTTTITRKTAHKPSSLEECFLKLLWKMELLRLMWINFYKVRKIPTYISAAAAAAGACSIINRKQYKLRCLLNLPLWYFEELQRNKKEKLPVALAWEGDLK